MEIADQENRKSSRVRHEESRPGEKEDLEVAEFCRKQP